jgi:hypothetical protein
MPPPTFCADFDEPDASPGAGWDQTAVPEGGSVELDSNQFSSPPRSLHAITTLGLSTGVGKAFTATTSFTVDLDVMFPSLDGDGGDTSPIKILCPGAHYVYFYATGDTSYFQIGGAEESPHMAPPTVAAWHHLTVAIALTPTTSIVNAFIDGNPVWPNHQMTVPWGSPAAVTLQAGVPAQFDELYGEAYVDNVVVRVN